MLLSFNLSPDIFSIISDAIFFEIFCIEDIEFFLSSKISLCAFDISFSIS